MFDRFIHTIIPKIKASIFSFFNFSDNSKFNYKIRDVIFGDNSTILNLRKRLPVIEFHKEEFKRYFKEQKRPLMIIFGVVFLFILMGAFFPSQASVSTFYPKKCLGGWEGPEHVEGVSDASILENNFSSKNSAILKDRIAEIFCGDFIGEVEPETVPKKFIVKMSWLVTDNILEEKKETLSDILPQEGLSVPAEEAPLTNVEIIEEKEVIQNIDTILDQEKETPVENNSVEIESNPVQDNPTENNPVEIILEEATPPPVSFLNNIFTKVFAQESQSAPESVPEVPTDAEVVVIPESSSTNIVETTLVENISVIENEDIVKEDSIEQIETETPTPVPSENIVEPIIENTGVTNIEEVKNKIDNDFLEVSYTIDGSNWKVLGKVSETTWKDASFEISDSSITTWEDVSKLQISVKNLPTIDTQPIIYLDNIYIEIEYGILEKIKELPVVEIEDENLGVISSTTISDFNSDESPTFEIGDPNLSIFEIEDLVKSGKAEIIKDPNGVLVNNLLFPDSAYNINLAEDTNDKENIIQQITNDILSTIDKKEQDTKGDASGIIIVPEEQSVNKKIEEVKQSEGIFPSLKNSIDDNLNTTLDNNPIAPTPLEDITSFLGTSVVFAGPLTNVKILGAEVVNILGEPTDIVANVKTVEVNGIAKEQVSVEKPGRQFRPGKYTLRVTFVTDTVKIISKQDFTWGVLAINTDKSIYKIGEKAYLQMGVLSDKGDTLCKANMSLVIKSPKGVETFFDTNDGSIVRDPACGPNNIIYVPDYYAYFDDIKEEGVYEMKLTATTENGPKSTTDTFSVVQNSLFEVARSGPTRINPLSPYTVIMKVKSNIDWSGIVQEKAPDNFDILESSKGIVYNNVEIVGKEKVISWNLSFKKNEEKILAYKFDAPNISPEFHLLGPLSFGKGVNLIWQETRNWQIANDAIVVDILTAGVSWSVPFDFDAAANTIEGIGGGGGAGGGGTGTARGGSGGGGG
ncbi:MAG: hypothetical protein AAB438_00665, partial [Patescibacteria group bacterium]